MSAAVGMLGSAPGLVTRQRGGGVGVDRGFAEGRAGGEAGAEGAAEGVAGADRVDRVDRVGGEQLRRRRRPPATPPRSPTVTITAAPSCWRREVAALNGSPADPLSAAASISFGTSTSTSPAKRSIPSRERRGGVEHDRGAGRPGDLGRAPRRPRAGSSSCSSSTAARSIVAGGRVDVGHRDRGGWRGG